MRVHLSHRLAVALATAAMINLTVANLSFAQAGAGGAGGGAGGPVGGGGAAGGIGGIGGGGSAGTSANISGAGAGIGGAGVGGGTLGGGTSGSGGAHQGNILTGPGASGIPQNYFRGAMPGMGLSPQEAPSGSLGRGLRRGRGASRSSGSRFGAARRRGGGGAVGRGVGPVPKGGDENPADTLLKEMNGSHDGRRTGHAALRPAPGYRRGKEGLSSDPPSLTPQRIEERAVYFAERGAYEDMVYHPYQGSYQRRRRSTAARSTAARRAPAGGGSRY